MGTERTGATAAEVAELQARALEMGWEEIRQGAWFEAFMTPVLLDDAPPAAGPLEQRVQQAQERIASASEAALAAQPEELIEDVLDGTLDALPEVLQQCVGRALFVTRELVLLARDGLAQEGHPPTADDLPACWELFASVVGVTPADFVDDAESEPAAAAGPAAPFGLRRPTQQVARMVGRRLVRHALWQTAVPRVGQTAWAGWSLLAARQVAQLCQSIHNPEADRTALLNYVRMHFEQAARLIVLGMWSMAVSDCSLHWSELDTINKVCAVLDIPGDTVRTMRSRSDVVEGEFLNDLERLAPLEARRLVHRAVEAAALADGRLEPAEMAYLQRISERLQEPWDEDAIRSRLAAAADP